MLCDGIVHLQLGYIRHPASEVRNRDTTVEDQRMDTDVKVPLSRRQSDQASSSGASRQKHKQTKPAYIWSHEEVMRWFKKHCADYYRKYAEAFTFHEITGQSLMRLTDEKLERMGITDQEHRADLMGHLYRLKLRHEGMELRALEKGPGLCYSG
ncbi:protein aveugle-like isoform X1 [Branchiostoma floridae x Branchiostoma belcheri]